MLLSLLIINNEHTEVLVDNQIECIYNVIFDVNADICLLCIGLLFGDQKLISALTLTKFPMWTSKSS